MKRSLTKEERLTRRTDIQRVFERGHTVRSTGLLLKALPNELDYGRVLVVPPRKSGTRVQKNRISRVGKEVYRHIKTEIEPGYDLVFVAYPGPYTFGERMAQFRRVLSEAGILRAHNLCEAD
jgi:ribonuclease P protein component